MKFTPEEGVVTVSTRHVRAHEGDRVELRVSDSGPGIAQSEQAAVFEAYYRSAGTAAAPGIGLGLAISHALVARMGGDLRVESTVGAGATFIISLPATTEAPPAAE